MPIITHVYTAADISTIVAIVYIGQHYYKFRFMFTTLYHYAHEQRESMVQEMSE